LARTINGLLEQLKIERYAFYLHDYGGPVGFRIISAHPQRLRALIIQNANAYQEGLGAKWGGIAQYWADPKAHPEVFDTFVSFAATEQRHTLGTSHPERYNPDIWTDEYVHLSKPGHREIQAARLYDYRTNVAIYPAWQEWLREHRPPVLVIGGGTIPRSSLPVRRRSSAICRMPKSTCSTPAILAWTRRTTT
jgi:pimeloyl-ACP methyl ester carboxylesterase